MTDTTSKSVNFSILLFELCVFTQLISQTLQFPTVLGIMGLVHYMRVVGRRDKARVSISVVYCSEIKCIVL